MPRSSPLAAALAALLVSAPAVSAADPIMPLSEVRAGMQCTARSVVQGTTISSFRADVVDVLGAPDDQEAAAILVRVSGPAVDATGVGQGFSGSPVLCPGADGVPRIAGAISQGILDFGNDVVLATPIEAVLRQPVDPPAAIRTDAVAGRILARSRPLAAPLSVGGLTPQLAGALTRAARRTGRALVAAPAAPRAGSAAPALQPGSSMAAGYVTGDLSLGAVGTVTYVDGDRVWGFGHELEAAGRRALFLQDAYVYTVVGNPLGIEPAVSFKLAAPGAVLGTLSGDGLRAVAGREGPWPPTVPLRILARDGDRGTEQSTDLRLADEAGVGLPTGVSVLAGIAPLAAADAAITVLGGAPLRQSVRMCARFGLRGRPPLRFCNAYVGAGVATEDGPMVFDLARATGLIDAFDAAPLPLGPATVELTLHRGLRQAFLVRLAGPRVARRGRTIRVRALLRAPGGARSWRALRVRVPSATRRGPRQLVLSGTPADEGGSGDVASLVEIVLDEGGDEAPQAPATVAALRRRIAGIHRFTGVRARFAAPGKAPRRPPARARGAVVLRDPAERISGVASLRLRVR